MIRHRSKKWCCQVLLNPSRVGAECRKIPRFLAGSSSHYLIQKNHRLSVDVEATRPIRQAKAGSLRMSLNRVKGRLYNRPLVSNDMKRDLAIEVLNMTFAFRAPQHHKRTASVIRIAAANIVHMTIKNSVSGKPYVVQPFLDGKNSKHLLRTATQEGAEDRQRLRLQLHRFTMASPHEACKRERYLPHKDHQEQHRDRCFALTCISLSALRLATLAGRRFIPPAGDEPRNMRPGPGRLLSFPA
ncbi:hypothetical protein SAMN05444414_11122 [Roseovarius marisflavi]|uniref:Uncharacterized protein n=1 Tax=Roseovarius marisflavi TaxID=1054996 RepID=A0A1M6ZS96_9RHOB|nr:hypothetical protein SAMN05444414_11122 [Roseovarius marisflavi]